MTPMVLPVLFEDFTGSEAFLACPVSLHLGFRKFLMLSYKCS